MSIYIIASTLFTGFLSVYFLKRSLEISAASCERIKSFIFAVSALLSAVETIYIYIMDEKLTVFLAVSLLILLFTGISTLFHYVISISSVPCPPKLLYIPVYFPPIYVLLLYLSGELDPDPITITTITGSKILIAEFGAYSEYLRILELVICACIIGLLVYDLFRGGEYRVKYLGVIFAVATAFVSVAVIERFYPPSIYAVTSYSTLFIPALIILYKLSKGNSLRLVKPASLVELEPALKRMIGRVNIFHDPTIERALQLFKEIHSLGIPGLCITRLTPQDIRRRFPGVKVIWLSEVKDESSIPPTHLSRLKASIEAFASKHERSVILLDGLEYLILYNGFDETAKLLNSIVDIAGYYNVTVIVPIDTKAMPESHVRLLERFTESEHSSYTGGLGY